MLLRKMKQYTLQQRINIHYENGKNLAETFRKTRTFFGCRQASCRTATQKLLQKLELLRQVIDVKNKTRARRSRTVTNIAAVAESIEENPDLLISRRSMELSIPQTSLHRILH